MTDNPALYDSSDETNRMVPLNDSSMGAARARSLADAVLAYRKGIDEYLRVTCGALQGREVLSERDIGGLEAGLRQEQSKLSGQLFASLKRDVGLAPVAVGGPLFGLGPESYAQKALLVYRDLLELRILYVNAHHAARRMDGQATLRALTQYVAQHNGRRPQQQIHTGVNRNGASYSAHFNNPELDYLGLPLLDAEVRSGTPAPYNRLPGAFYQKLGIAICAKIDDLVREFSARGQDRLAKLWVESKGRVTSRRTTQMLRVDPSFLESQFDE